MLVEVQTLDVISINIWQILVSLINLLLIFLMLKKFLYKPVRKILSERQSQVDKVYNDANVAQAVAETERAKYEEKLASADQEASAIMSDAKARAERMEKEIVQDASARADKMIQQADEEIAQERKKAMNEMKDDISNISVDIAEKVIGREIHEEDHQNLIDQFIDEIGDDNG